MKTRLTASAILFTLIYAFSGIAAVNDGLILYYSFDNQVSGPVTDLSGNGHPGAVYGATFTSNGHCGAAAHFNGNRSYILAGNLGYVPEGTISFWMNADVLENSRNVFTTEYAGWDDCMKFESAADGSFVVGALPIVGWYTTSLSASNWNHVVFSWTKTNAWGYFNGEKKFDLSHSGVYPPGINLNLNNVAVGNGYSTALNRYWKGMVDEVRIYNRALDPQEIADLCSGCPSAAWDAAPGVCLIGFSNDPEGDQDVTEFYNDETLHISVQDVDLDENNPLTRVTAHLVQKTPKPGARKSERRILLTPTGTGRYAGSIPLNSFSEGETMVVIQAFSPKGPILSRHSTIRIMNAAAGN
ncbi:MAG: LamG domain-containing protein [Kiritimatiellia bacterium]